MEDRCEGLSFGILAPPGLATLLAIGCGLVSIALASGRRRMLLIRISGALLAGVALFGLLPELTEEIGWLVTLALAGFGYGVLAILDHQGYAVCPSCSHGEKFAGSLVAATAVHAFVDGWGLVAAQGEGAVSGALVAAILIHKAPEGLALGAMLRASSSSARMAVLLCCLAEIPTMVGGAAGFWFTPPGWIDYLLSVVAGTFLFLGIHALRPGKGH